MYSPYWTYSGWFSPSSTAIRCFNSGLASKGAMTVIGLPGVMNRSRNTTVTTPQMTKIPCTLRRSRNRPIDIYEHPIDCNLIYFGEMAYASMRSSGGPST